MNDLSRIVQGRVRCFRGGRSMQRSEASGVLSRIRLIFGSPRFRFQTQDAKAYIIENRSKQIVILAGLEEFRRGE